MYRPAILSVGGTLGMEEHDNLSDYTQGQL